jgi:hypothetical protein
MPNHFKKAIADAEAREAYSTARRIDGERRIASALVRAILDAEYDVGVNDGEETTVASTNNAKKAIDALFTTDEDYILVMSRVTPGTQIGWFWFIYGNDGYDVISDYAGNKVCDDLVKSIESVVKKVEKATR